ncbi:GntR family transcriptional regulator [Actinomycetospora sp. CA-101289]|uniref:GntR family transcriptional regulator n=1 Tax=Actinomycetospora sp. CA-101289 TaxID=3239893 RepID=UPI003D9590D1
MAVPIRDRILGGEWAPGAQLPTGKQLGKDFTVATATAQRAFTLLQDWGLVEVSRGRRPVILDACLEKPSTTLE